MEYQSSILAKDAGIKRAHAVIRLLCSVQVHSRTLIPTILLTQLQ
ncbi:hypothetical protein FOMG_19409 [Fusarium oxysporum f. sp. melonis 26406]|uniref:Uncharacterized protein n=1 Tax=Fusarium oxysporum f. sp. melonis 26406 TaxID=1089452 RepID=W9Z5D6_FUSOX|nr:hypothetical protein FOMG_19409 [Fusarium oxysporum f. sp. melonis 26406]